MKPKATAPRLAKVVAARKSARWKTPEDLDRLYHQEAETRSYPPDKWWRLSGKEQTDDPAIRQAYEAGKAYRDIRDKIRAEWKP